MRLSIRWRLTLWYTAALAVVLAGFGAGVYGLLARALVRRADDLLRTQAEILEHERDDPEVARNRQAAVAHWFEEFQEHANVLAVAYDPQGVPYEHTPSLDASSLPAVPPLAVGQHQFGEAVLPGAGRQRTLATRLALGGEDYTILLMAGLGDADLALAQLLTVLLMAGPAALLAAGAAGYWLAGKSLKPIDQLDRQAREITADRLDRRLPVANPTDELGRLARTINDMIARLERSFAEVRRFTADASHELRTPLTALRIEAEMALGKSLSPADCQHLLGSILEECERLTHLTDQLLTLSREDAGSARPAREPVDLGALVEGVVETMRPLADVKGLRLHAQGNGKLHVRGDEGRLRQVFYNLLDNAIKYTPDGGAVEVTLEQRDGAAVVTLRDTGIGIAAHHLPHVFERFYRVDKARSRAEGGTGLGLSIVRSIVAAHGGEVELASEPGRGTVCTVTLPGE